MGNNQVRYEGAKDSHGRMHGEGEVFFADGSSYKGQFVNGRYGGKGTLTCSSGDVYEGEFEDGQGHGQGTYKHQSGHEYVGEFRSGRRWGKGVLTDGATGERYEGEWFNDQLTGRGTADLADGSHYDGQWKNGERHGRGVSTWKDGESYEGEWSHNEREGLGVVRHADESLYEGEWAGSERKGLGIYWSSDGKGYEGQWQDDKPHGWGVEMYPADGSRFEGKFKDGLREANGQRVFPDGRTEQGVWTQGNLKKEHPKRGEKGGKKGREVADKAKRTVMPAARGVAVKACTPEANLVNQMAGHYALLCASAAPISHPSLAKDVTDLEKALVDGGGFLPNNVITCTSVSETSLSEAFEAIKAKMEEQLEANGDSKDQGGEDSSKAFMFFLYFTGSAVQQDDVESVVLNDDAGGYVFMTMSSVYEMIQDMPVIHASVFVDVQRPPVDISPFPYEFHKLGYKSLLARKPDGCRITVFSSASPGDECAVSREREGSLFCKYIIGAMQCRLSKEHYSCCGGQDNCVYCRKFVASVRIGDGYVYLLDVVKYVGNHMFQEYPMQKARYYSSMTGGLAAEINIRMSRPSNPTDPDFAAAQRADDA